MLISEELWLLLLQLLLVFITVSRILHLLYRRMTWRIRTRSLYKKDVKIKQEKMNRIGVVTRVCWTVKRLFKRLFAMSQRKMWCLCAKCGTIRRDVLTEQQLSSRPCDRCGVFMTPHEGAWYPPRPFYQEWDSKLSRECDVDVDLLYSRITMKLTEIIFTMQSKKMHLVHCTNRLVECPVGTMLRELVVSELLDAKYLKEERAVIGEELLLRQQRELLSTLETLMGKVSQMN